MPISVAIISKYATAAAKANDVSLSSERALCKEFTSQFPLRESEMMFQEGYVTQARLTLLELFQLISSGYAKCDRAS